jgi:hypothetical protein
LQLVLSDAEKQYAKLASATAKAFVAASDPAAWSESDDVSQLIRSLTPTKACASRARMQIDSPPEPPLVGVWVHRVIAYSSQFGRSSWAATNIRGKPKSIKYGHGDYTTAWAPLQAGSRNEFLELQFDGKLYAHEIQVFENFNPGAIVRASVWSTERHDWRTVFQQASRCGTIVRAQRLIIVIPDDVRVHEPIDRIRLDVDQNGCEHRYQIEAVRLIGLAAASAKKQENCCIA